MKKRIACVAVLVFWCLLMCTVISVKMQEVMKIEVIVVTPDKKDFLPEEVVYTDDEGTHIYKIENGDEWTPGLRVREVNPGEYMIGADGVRLNTFESAKYIQFASRPFKLDDAVKIAPKCEKIEDTYVVSDGVTSWTVKSARITDFIESQAKHELGLDENTHVYSMHDKKQFQKQLVLISIMALACVFVLSEGILTCIRLPELLDKSHAIIWRCIVLMIITMCLFAGVCLIDIPASMI